MLNNVRRQRIFWPLCALLCALLMQTVSAAGVPPKPNQAFFPSASDKQYKKSGAVIDYGNGFNGYVMVKYTKSGNKRIKCVVTKDDETYQYDIPRDGEFVVLPLQMGSGSYKIAIYEQVKGTKYSAKASYTVKAKIDSKYIPYLYPNQYVNYTPDSRAVAKSKELCEGLETERAKYDAIWEFCTEKITYHYIRAMEVSSGSSTGGYLPDIDETLREGLGICFDYAALMACMLRTQSIPTQLVIGNADNQYHAWNRVMLDGEWVRADATYGATGSIASEYTEERRY